MSVGLCMGLLTACSNNDNSFNDSTATVEKESAEKTGPVITSSHKNIKQAKNVPDIGGTEEYVLSLFNGSQTSNENRGKIFAALPDIDWKKMSQSDAYGNTCMELLSWIYTLNVTDNNEISSLLKATHNLDGAYAESMAAIYGKCFSNNPVQFLESLSMLPDGQKSVVSSLLVYNACYGNLISFENSIIAIKEDKNTPEGIIPAPDSVLDAINKLNAAMSANHSGQIPEKPETELFHTDTIRRFIELNKELGYPYNEEYCETIAKAFNTDCILFAKMISEIEDIDIEKVSKQIAHDNKRKNAETKFLDDMQKSSEYAKLSENEKEILDKMTYYIKVEETTFVSD